MGKEEIEKLKSMVDWFYNNQGINRITIEFKKPLEVDRGYFFSEIATGYSSTGWASDHDTYIDVFMGKQTKLIAEYSVDKVNDRVQIYRIELWRRDTQ